MVEHASQWMMQLPPTSRNSLPPDPTAATATANDTPTPTAAHATTSTNTTTTTTTNTITFSTTDPNLVHGHEAPFVQPSSYLRPRGLSHPMRPAEPERAIDREEREGLFPLREGEFEYPDSKWHVYILLACGSGPWGRPEYPPKAAPIPILLRSRLEPDMLTGLGCLLTTSDYINVIQYYFQNPAALDQIDQFRLDSLREVEKALGVAPPETISIGPERPLYEACRRMLESRARRIPLVTNDSQTDRPHVLSVLTQYRILKFVAVNVSDTQKLKKPLKEILLGTYDNIATASMDTPVIDVIHILVERSISSVPILNSEGVVYNVFEAVDVITLIKGGVYDDLSLTVGEALKKRSAEFPGIYTCSLNDGLDTIFDTIRKSRVHRLVVVDGDFRLKGVLTLSDILQYILLEGENDESS
ncbi:hypothetical protein CDV55_100660 [Aspergillus turcosus]|uniref:CBS domain-containing protein n=1 Tax=Aspergillus turcosus TaxID=1245748 RepID=A0A229WZC8_9EURO|nr:hypothetical protein CDV55_100660 [Aspergillus turcosus]RLL93988.1 hypothetical protein CFD26_100718 [Aspergillus turcosus]